MPCPAHIQIVLRTLLFQVCVHNFLDQFVPSYIERVFRIFIEMFFVIISISIYIFGIYLILVLSNCNAIQSTDCHVRYFNKLSIYPSIYALTFSYVNFLSGPMSVVLILNTSFFFRSNASSVLLINRNELKQSILHFC